MITVMQMMWIAGVCIMALSLFLDNRLAALAVVMVAFSGWVVWSISPRCPDPLPKPTVERQHTVLIVNGKHMEF